MYKMQKNVWKYIKNILICYYNNIERICGLKKVVMIEDNTLLF